MNNKREVTDLVQGTQWKNLLRQVETCFSQSQKISDRVYNCRQFSCCLYLLIAEVKSTWICTSTPPYAFMV
jgi:hypothetical protein